MMLKGPIFVTNWLVMKTSNVVSINKSDKKKEKKVSTCEITSKVKVK